MLSPNREIHAGLLIGYDAMFPESGRVLSIRGCDLIVCPSLLKHATPMAHPRTAVKQNYPIPTGADPHHWHLLRVRAGENNVYFALQMLPMRIPVISERAAYSDRKRFGFRVTNLSSGVEKAWPCWRWIRRIWMRHI